MALEDDLLQLARLDRAVVRCVVESDWERLQGSLSAYHVLRQRIRIDLISQENVRIASSEARAVLQKITTGEGFPTDHVIERLHALSGADNPAEEFTADQLEELGSELFYSWFSHYEYITGLAELRPLIVNAPLSDGVSRLVGQIKNCYAFQQYDAAYSLCRTLIEASIRDICVRRELFPTLGENVVLFERFNWGQLRDRVATGELRQRLTSLYSDLSTVLHGRRSVSKDEARQAFGETLSVIEHLYATHGL